MFLTSTVCFCLNGPSADAPLEGQTVCDSGRAVPVDTKWSDRSAGAGADVHRSQSLQLTLPVCQILFSDSARLSDGKRDLSFSRFYRQTQESILCAFVRFVASRLGLLKGVGHGVLDRFRLDGKRLFVTGGSRGLGREMALAIADAGADVVLVGRDLASLEKTAADIRSLGRKAWPIQGDAGIPAECERICRTALDDFGRSTS